MKNNIIILIKYIILFCLLFVYYYLSSFFCILFQKFIPDFEFVKIVIITGFPVILISNLIHKNILNNCLKRNYILCLFLLIELFYFPFKMVQSNKAKTEGQPIEVTINDIFHVYYITIFGSGHRAWEMSSKRVDDDLIIEKVENKTE